MFNKFETIESLPKGTKYTISQIGYYNFWYPSSNKHEQGELASPVSGVRLGWVGGGHAWVPYQVTGDVAKRHGSPIRVLWFEIEER